MFLLTDGWWGCADKVDGLIIPLVKKARKEGQCETATSQKHVMIPRLVYRGVPGLFPGAENDSRRPPGLSLVSFSWRWRARKVAWSCSNLPESPRRTRAECRARVRWLDPLASAAQYLHREASTSVTSNTRQASGGASGRVFLHIVGLFFPARPRSWLRNSGTGGIRFCVRVRGANFIPLPESVFA